MILKNTPDKYGAIAIAFHWTSALIAIGLFASGLWMTSLSYYSPWYHTAPELHKGFGMILVGLSLARFTWKSIAGSPEGIGNAFEKKAASIMHILLYVLLISLFMSGYVIATADGRPVNVLGLFEFPALFAAKGSEAIAGKVHLFSAWSLAVMVCLHAAAALKHHFVDRDGVFIRMLGIASK
ncbi:cytochrome b [Falsochrobactrum sp. TDYN1]|uniref:Cytochrome b n=1 Tax=Falsochrobactrum tianjinense TaxID=2706015 RepID=A0A949PLZ3_9HYPH|nr:cytochrome b [Falsochrobactrum sp. TDYN1]MBV2143513.1 cytochrome b [Falsochrobactrum sp. TDYN1]